MKKAYLVSYINKSSVKGQGSILELPFNGVFNGFNIKKVSLESTIVKGSVKFNCDCICYVLIEYVSGDTIRGKLLSIKYL